MIRPEYEISFEGGETQGYLPVDATPDEEYPLRILRAYREQCNRRIVSTPPNLLCDVMNEHNEKRAEILDRAIAVLSGSGSKSAKRENTMTPSGKLKPGLKDIHHLLEDAKAVALYAGLEVTDEDIKRLAARLEDEIARIEADLNKVRPMTMEDLTVNEYLLDDGGKWRIDTVLKRAPQMDGVIKWKIQKGHLVLGKDYQWDLEPQPSSRKEEYLERTRFDSPEEALAAYNKLKQ